MKLVGSTLSVLATAVAVAVVLGSLGGKPTVEVALEDPTGLEEGASTNETGEAVGGSKERSQGIIFTLQAAVVHEGKLHWAALKPGSIASWDGRKWRPVTGWFGGKLEHEVEVMTVDTPGWVLAGGHSLKLGPGVRATVALWNGWRWRALGNGPAVTAKARFRPLAHGPKGRVYLLFDEYGEAGAHSHLWEWDGHRHWREMPGAEFMSELAVTADGSVYVAGRFGPPSLPEGTSLARWDGRVLSQGPDSEPGEARFGGELSMPNLDAPASEFGHGGLGAVGGGGGIDRRVQGWAINWRTSTASMPAARIASRPRSVSS
jgi:hypothetical protein